MARKQLIYYARTYRHLLASAIKSILFILLLILPSLILMAVNIGALTGFISGVGVRILGKAFPGIPMYIASSDFWLLGSIRYINMPAVYPSLPFIFANLVAAFVFLFFLSTGKRRGRPLSIYLVISIMIHIVSCVFFLFAPNNFPYLMLHFSDLYMVQQLSIWLLFIVLSGAAIGFVGGSGYPYKCLTFVAIMAYSVVFGSVRYIVFLFLLQRFSMLYMTLMFFVLGPSFDFLYLVCIYSFFINKMMRYYVEGKGREEWEWP